MNSISINDYQGTNIEKAFGIGVLEYSNPLTSDKIKDALDWKLEKGLIDKPLYDKAVEQLNGLIEKAGKGKGEGSRGGHVIGHTKSGKPVYQDNKWSEHKEYKDFTSQDHKDAANIHHEKAKFHMSETDKLREGGYANQDHKTLASHHSQAGSQHEMTALNQDEAKHKQSLSDSEKKILADQKKKQIEHHQKMKDYHYEAAGKLEASFGDAKRNMANAPDEVRSEHSRHVDQFNHHHREYERLSNEK